jgi:hypothetical protein
VDVLAWHPHRRALLIVEVKSRLANLQETCRALDTKARVVPRLAGQARGWRPEVVGILLVVQHCTREREAVSRRSAIFAASFPARNLEIRSWLRNPARPIRGLLFVRFANTICVKTGMRPGARVRKPRQPV